MSGSGWCTIESDPGVFTELIEKLGVKGLQVVDLYTLEEAEVKKHAPVYGLVFLFKWVGKKQKVTSTEIAPGGLFFARQMVTNACATQAILHILLNIENPEKRKNPVVLGKTLTTLKDFSGGLSAEGIGETIGELSAIREAHNSFARPEPFVLEKVAAKKGDDVFHFISYLPFKGKLLELDGLKPSPIVHGDLKEGEFVKMAGDVIKKRIEIYQSGEIKFHLMALVHNKKDLYDNEMIELTKALETETDEAKKQTIGAQIQNVLQMIQYEKNLKKKWTEENIRRRHNYVPFLIKLLNVLAENKQLVKLVDETKKREEIKKQAETKKEKEKEKDDDVVMEDKKKE